MSEAAPHTTAHPAAPRLDATAVARLRALSRPSISAREFVRSVSPFEIVALIGLVLLIAGVLVVYSYLILPDQVSFVQLSGQVSDNNTKIDELRATVTDPTSMAQRFDEVRSSLDTFRGATLKPRLEGRRAIIDTVERVTRETGAQLSSSVSFTTRALASEREEQRGRNVAGGEDEAVTSYPSLSVEFSVTGTYEQLRRLITRLESSDQFVVIDSISLATGQQLEETPARRGVPSSGSGVVTLSIVMTAYFQAETPAGVQ